MAMWREQKIDPRQFAEKRMRVWKDAGILHRSFPEQTRRVAVHEKSSQVFARPRKVQEITRFEVLKDLSMTRIRDPIMQNRRQGTNL